MNSDELQQATSRTLASYQQRAAAFWEGTRDHDVSQNIEALLSQIHATAPLTILDFGCGPGRDLKAFTARGHIAIGLDGVERFAEMAREHSGCEVWHQDFCRLQLPTSFFDGVFANASLFHVPRAELPRVLSELFTSLKPGGVLFSSNPRGDNEEGWRGQSGDRYGVAHDWPSWQSFMVGAGFIELLHYYRPDGLPREQQPWLASVWRKPE